MKMKEIVIVKFTRSSFATLYKKAFSITIFCVISLFYLLVLLFAILIIWDK